MRHLFVDGPVEDCGNRRAGVPPTHERLRLAKKPSADSRLARLLFSFSIQSIPRPQALITKKFDNHKKRP